MRSVGILNVLSQQICNWINKLGFNYYQNNLFSLIQLPNLKTSACLSFKIVYMETVSQKCWIMSTQPLLDTHTSTS